MTGGSPLSLSATHEHNGGALRSLMPSCVVVSSDASIQVPKMGGREEGLHMTVA